jgi:hypothetical protein
MISSVAALSAKAPRAAGYRGSDFVLWHLAAMSNYRSVCITPEADYDSGEPLRFDVDIQRSHVGTATKPTSRSVCPSWSSGLCHPASLEIVA